MILSIIGFVISYALGGILLIYALGGILFILGAMITFSVFIKVNSTEVAITNKRVVVKTGVLSRKIIELQLNRSEGLRISENLTGRLFGYGSIRITSGGISEGLDYLSKPFEFKKQVNNAIEQSFPINTNSAAY